MTSRSFDGEYIARFHSTIRLWRGAWLFHSGATGAIVEMIRLMRNGSPAAFTIDGPKGPRYVAKMGAVLLAKKPAIRFCRSQLRRIGFGKQRRAGTDLKSLPFRPRARFDCAADLCSGERRRRVARI